jgi:hypothetical protein
MVSESSATDVSDNNASGSSSRLLRFKWAALYAIVVFIAIYAINLWLAHHGLRLEARIGDSLLLALLVFVLLVVQQLGYERELRRHAKIMGIIAEMNHHTRNALQVIVGTSYMGQPHVDANAIDAIRQAVKRIEWCLREILPNAEDSLPKKAVGSESLRHKIAIARSHKSGL